MESLTIDTAEYLDAGTSSYVELMDILRGINGYKAAAIMADDGELLYSNSANPVNDHAFSNLITVINDYYGLASSLNEKSGFVSSAEVSFRSADDVVVIHRSSKDCLVGIRLLVLIAGQGSVAMIQRKLRHLLPQIMRCFTWNPDNLVPLYIRDAKNHRSINMLAS